jgi:hypothetical protein
MSDYQIAKMNKLEEKKDRVYCCLTVLAVFLFWVGIIYWAVEIYFK